MGLFSSKDDRTKEEKAVARMQHRAYKDAGNQAAARVRDKHMVHDQFTEAVCDTDADVPWWRR